MTQEELQLVLDALKWCHGGEPCGTAEAIAVVEKALAQEQEQVPVAWLITDEKINSLQVDSIQRLIDRARHAHMTDIKLRINGQDEWYQADWLKHLIRAASPQRTWVGLDHHDKKKFSSWLDHKTDDEVFTAIEAKLKQKNGYAEEKNT